MALISRFVFPAGVCMPYAGASEPSGWLFCYGQAVSRSAFKKLFDALGTVYGVGDGATTFNLPDMRGRTPFGKDDMGGVVAGRINAAGAGVDAENLGAVGGSQTTTLTSSQLAGHSHLAGSVFLAGNGTNGVGPQTANVRKNETTAGATGSSGSNAQHNNLPPAIILNYIISTGV